MNNKICGLKLTHDAAVAGIEGNKLVFCVEVEKLNNNPRYTKMPDLSLIGSILRDFNFDPDIFVIDGWKGSTIHRPDYNLPVSGYHEFDGRKGRNFWSEGLHVLGKSRPYASYPHMSSHIFGAYATAPFAGEPAYILTWDGGQNPRIHFLKPGEQTQFVTSLFELYGIIYGIMGYYFGPYKINTKELLHRLDAGEEMKGGGYDKPGKLMSYIALGKVCWELMPYIHNAYLNAVVCHLPKDRLAYNQSAVLEHSFMQNIESSVKVNFIELSDADVLRTIHEWLSERLVNRTIAAVPHRSNLCFAGGSALNIKWNSALRNSEHFKSVWVPPFPNDCGSAIGTAVCEMVNNGNYVLDWNVYSGPRLLSPYVPVNPRWEESNCTLAQLARIFYCEPSEPVVFLNDRAEVGPRALGNRSILCSPLLASNKDLINRLKQREAFRPVAPICMEEHAQSIFDPGTPDPYMLFDHKVRNFYLHRIPAVVHLDHTARLQTVNRSQNWSIHELLTQYQRLSGYPLLCNTSANWNGSGFFPDIESAMTWGMTKYIWAAGRLFTNHGHIGGR